jgi:hypothetical protein
MTTHPRIRLTWTNAKGRTASGRWQPDTPATRRFIVGWAAHLNEVLSAEVATDHRIETSGGEE